MKVRSRCGDREGHGGVLFPAGSYAHRCMCVCVCVCIWLAGSSSLHVSFPKPFLKSRCELPIKERKLTVLKGRRAADDSLWVSLCPAGLYLLLSGLRGGRGLRGPGGRSGGYCPGLWRTAEELCHSRPELAPLLSRARRHSLSGAAQACRRRPASQKGPRLRGGSAS